MPYVITEPCIDVKDGTCVDVCPVDAIYSSWELPDGQEAYEKINADFFRAKA